MPSCVARCLPFLSGDRPHRERQVVFNKGGNAVTSVHSSVISGQPSATGTCLNLPQAMLTPEALPSPGQTGTAPRPCGQGLEEVKVPPEGSGGEKTRLEVSGAAAASSPETPGDSLCCVWPAVGENGVGPTS